MAEDEKKNIARLEIMPGRVVDDSAEVEVMNFSWSAVSCLKDPTARKHGSDNFLSERIDFTGKNLEEGSFSKENLQGASFSVANLKNINLSGANLKDTDFAGADLSGANLSGADLSGANFSGAKLIGTDFTGAVLKGIKLRDADITDAVLLDMEIDEFSLEELQELIEYLAVHFPHKLNLTKINLTLLDLSKIDLRSVSLRGVDFTGCNMTGVNIAELDLSECIITPEQIAQALGRVPSMEELAKLMAPKPKEKGGKGGAGIDFSEFFHDNKEFGVWNAGSKFSDIGVLIDAGKKVFRHSAQKPEVKDEEILQKIKEDRAKEATSDKEALRLKIEQNKRKELERRKEMHKEVEVNKSPPKYNDKSMERIQNMRGGRD